MRCTTTAATVICGAVGRYAYLFAGTSSAAAIRFLATWDASSRRRLSLGGPSPQVALAYSAQSVDGHTAASNNQPSWIGEGFEYAPGSITRSYKACSDDMGGTANNSTKTGDQCWATDNATISFGAMSGQLVKSGDSWRPKTTTGPRSSG